MSFRGRLNLFFVFIVVVPMLAVTVMFYGLIGRSADKQRRADDAAQQTAAVGLAEDARARAGAVIDDIGRDAALAAALRSGDRAALRRRATRLLREEAARRILIRRGDRVLVDAGGRSAIFPAVRELQDADGRSFGRLEVSVQGPRAYVRAVRSATRVDALVVRAGTVLASTGSRIARADLPREDRAAIDIAGERLRTSWFQIPRSFFGAQDQVWLVRPAGAGPAAGESRLNALAIMLGFFVVAFAFAVLVSRSLQREIGAFLDAARRLGAGDFSAQVRVTGRDELAGLGREFNQMATQLRERLEELRTERERLQQAMRRIGAAFASNLDRNGLLRVVVEAAVDGIGAAAGRAVVRSAAGTGLAPVAHHGADAGDLAEGLRAAEARVLETAMPADVALEDVIALAHPLRGQGAVDAVMGIVSVARRGRPFSPAERDLFAYLAAQAAVSVENVGLHEAVERQALTDELTGLSNRRRFDEALEAEAERSRRFGAPVALLLLDIDDFKKVNDTFGHPQGDVVLQHVAGVLRASCREIDEPARYGGEELAAVLPGTDLAGAVNLAERVRAGLEALAVPRLGRDDTIAVTASFGVATIPSSAQSVEDLVAAADDALYRAKRGGKNRVEAAAPALP